MRKEADHVMEVRELLAEAGLSELMRDSTIPQEQSISLVTSDSRLVRPGGCFVAVRGGRVDGHAFIDEAVRRGAAMVVAEDDVVTDGAVGIRVTDARSALARLAAAYHRVSGDGGARGLTLVGVTGTNGKTTTTMMIRSILQAAGHRTALLGTVGYDLVGEHRKAAWTTPPADVLAEMLGTSVRYGATHAVLEVSSHALDQRRCDGIEFDVAVFTNISGDHLDYHEDFDAYLSAKKRLFDGLGASGAAVVNAEDGNSGAMVADYSGRVVRFGVTGEADVSAAIVAESIDGSTFDLQLGGETVRVTLPLVGTYNVSNAVAAAAAARELGVEVNAIGRGLETLAGVPGRLQRVPTGKRSVHVFVDYAHTDDALVNVLGALSPLVDGRLICVFGCGGDRDRTKRPRMARAVERFADVAVVTSDNPRHEEPMAIIDDILEGFSGDKRCEVVVEADRAMAIRRACDMTGRGDTVLIAGKGHEDYQILGDQTVPFDDVQVATEALAAVGTKR